MARCSKCGAFGDFFEAGIMCDHCGFIHWGKVAACVLDYRGFQKGVGEYHRGDEQCIPATSAAAVIPGRCERIRGWLEEDG